MRFTVKVKPRSPSQRAEVIRSHELTVWVQSEARDGKANKELLSFLKKTIRKSTGRKPSIHIISGGTSKIKVLESDSRWEEVISTFSPGKRQKEQENDL
ncbi:MAG: DUF167 domain-containing protein [archaeon]|jgi:uncharacterized protein YggU (UPF0235/DUF167 family)|nr:hypothetical protein [Euryarchaeota archaeon]MDP6704004.1 DUF167 domain-containing protein [archaeon]MDP7260698.1 DUF167 domain-containing protein [archaeon]|tara:strand:- start:21700 stop:21996 length:297 start_codon:yes stop_codon:yes gene_type:complete